MKSKFLSVFSVAVLALVATVPLSQAKTYSVNQFKAELKTKIGTKKGLAAANAAANFYGIVLKDAKNKKNVNSYAKVIVSFIKKPTVVPTPLQGQSVNAQIKKLTTGYFTKLKFDLNDKRFKQALDTFLKSVQPTQKTAANSQLFYNSIKVYALKKKETQANVYQYFTAITDQLNYPDPPKS